MNRNTRTNTSMEDNPWTDTDRHWSDRDPPGSPGFPLPPPDPRQFGDEQVVEVAEELCRGATGNTLRCRMSLCYAVSAIPLHPTILALYRHRGCTRISRTVRGAGKSIGPRRTGSQSLAALGTMAGWVLTSVAHLLQIASYL